jgi:hypothetical protein
VVVVAAYGEVSGAEGLWAYCLGALVGAIVIARGYGSHATCGGVEGYYFTHVA